MKNYALFLSAFATRSWKISPLCFSMSVCVPVTSLEQLNGFSLKSILGSLSRICGDRGVQFQFEQKRWEY